ncbi:MAG: beta-lactamase family protein, partial [Cyclobacteriaceae bacterium]|nr:beta-lactamase family protein [Cyclobacteriaceae bacterium]
MRRILLGLCLLLTSHAFAQSVNTLTELQDSIKRIMEKEHIPGLMIALVHRDSVIWEGGLGTADLRSQTPVNSHHRFRVGSITKTFTALAIQQLVREGKFG